MIEEMTKGVKDSLRVKAVAGARPLVYTVGRSRLPGGTGRRTHGRRPA